MEEKVTGIDKKYNDKTHVYGRVWSAAAVLVFLLMPTLISIHLHAWPTAGAFASAALMYVIFAVGGVGEDLMYTTLIGPSATYVSFLTGNISNLKFPCTSAAIQSAGVDIHSDEGEVLATIASTVSSIVTTIIIAVFCVALAPVIPLMTQTDSLFYPAFKQVLPALFGAIIVPYCVKNPKLWELPFVVMVVLYWFIPGMKVSYGMFISVVVAMLGAVVMYKAGWLGNKKEKAAEAAAESDSKDDE